MADDLNALKETLGSAIFDYIDPAKAWVNDAGEFHKNWDLRAIFSSNVAHKGINYTLDSHIKMLVRGGKTQQEAVKETSDEVKKRLEKRINSWVEEAANAPDKAKAFQILIEEMTENVGSSHLTEKDKEALAKALEEKFDEIAKQKGQAFTWPATKTPAARKTKADLQAAVEKFGEAIGLKDKFGDSVKISLGSDTEMTGGNYFIKVEVPKEALEKIPEDARSTFLGQLNDRMWSEFGQLETQGKVGGFSSGGVGGSMMRFNFRADANKASVIKDIEAFINEKEDPSLVESAIEKAQQYTQYNNVISAAFGSKHSLYAGATTHALSPALEEGIKDKEQFVKDIKGLFVKHFGFSEDQFKDYKSDDKTKGVEIYTKVIEEYDAKNGQGAFVKKFNSTEVKNEFDAVHKAAGLETPKVPKKKSGKMDPKQQAIEAVAGLLGGSFAGLLTHGVFESGLDKEIEKRMAGGASKNPQKYADKLDDALGVGSALGVKPKVVETIDPDSKNVTRNIIYDFSGKDSKGQPFSPALATKLSNVINNAFRENGLSDAAPSYWVQDNKLVFSFKSVEDESKKDPEYFVKLSKAKDDIQKAIPGTLEEAKKESAKKTGREDSVADKAGAGDETPPPGDDDPWKKMLSFMGDNQNMIIFGLLALFVGLMFNNPTLALAGGAAGAGFGAMADGKKGVFKFGDNTEAAAKLGMTPELHEAVVGYAQVRFIDNAGKFRDAKAKQFVQDFSDMVKGERPDEQNKRAAALAADTATIQASLQKASGHRAHNDKASMKIAFGQANEGMTAADKLIGLDNMGTPPDFNNIKMPPAQRHAQVQHNAHQRSNPNR